MASILKEKRKSMAPESRRKANREWPLEAQPSPVISRPWKKRWLWVRFLSRFIPSIFRETRSIRGSIRVFRALRARHQEAHDFGLMGKLVEVDGRLFWHLFAAGAPSAAAREVRRQEIGRVLFPGRPVGLRTLMLAITKKCPLACEHCFEGDYVQGEEVLSRNDLHEIVSQYQEAGTPVIWLSGGEPMARYRDLRDLLQQAQPGTDFWIVTSGYRLNEPAAKALKADGLTGAIISLDHHDPEAHNRFRGSGRAFDWAVRACIAAKKAGLVTALSLCATRNFVGEVNFRLYMDLARHLGVAFVQLLEPKAAGRYAGKDVALYPDQMALLEGLAVEYNTSPQYADYPVVDYVDFLSRRIGCSAVGRRYLYINSDGKVQICPFCGTEVTRALAFSAEDTIRLAAQLQCPDFATAEI